MLFFIINTRDLQTSIQNQELNQVQNISSTAEGFSLLWIIILILACLLILSLIIMIKQRVIIRKINPEQLKDIIRENELLNALINNMPDRIYIKDKDSRFLIANKHVAATMGVDDPSKLIGKTDFDFFDEAIAGNFYNDERSIVEQGISIINKEEKGFDVDGSERIVSTTKIPVFGKDNLIYGIVGIGRDITRLKENEHKLKEQADNLLKINRLLKERQKEIEQMAEEMRSQSEAIKQANIQLEKLSLVASKTHNIVIIMDSNGNFEWVNQGFTDLYGCTLEEFTRKHGENIRENSANSNISAILCQIYITREPFNYNTRNIDREGKEKWYQTNITPILDEDGYVDRLILIDTDITDLKMAENLIKAQKVELEINRDELRLLNATKDRLFSIIAHDLKNPFQSIIGFSELLRDNFEDIEKERIQEYIDLIHDASVNAHELLKNLLDWSLSQLNHITLNPEQLSIKSLITNTIELLKPIAISKEIKLIDKSGEKDFACADSNMINTVLQNIASNAIKFTNKGGAVTFETESRDELIKIKIIDTGIGMTREKINALFNLENITTTAGTYGETGTGLGLIVCKEFIEKNKGKLFISSQPGLGTTVTLHLPVS